jgi:hypothetical protein
MADEAIGTLARVLTATATTTPPLAEPERPEWISALSAARIPGVGKPLVAARCHRGGGKKGIA